ncbi:Angiogenic factor with G patch and FHA domains 1 [Nymphon striatum]|nr:Angiogenic factor with G patch and FHA domains 1 [Nymphon striatum]
MMNDNAEESFSEQVIALKKEIIELKTLLESKDEEISNLKNQVLRITRLHEKSYKYCEDLRNHSENLQSQLNEENKSSSKTLVDAEVQVDFPNTEKSSASSEDWKDGVNSGFKLAAETSQVKVVEVTTNELDERYKKLNLDKAFRDATLVKRIADMHFMIVDQDQTVYFHLTIDALATCSIGELVKSAAQQVVTEQGFTYDDESKYYYHHSTGYYYSAESGLYYDPKTGIYFYYNHETGNYDFHSQVTPNQLEKHENNEKLMKGSNHGADSDIDSLTSYMSYLNFGNQYNYNSSSKVNSANKNKRTRETASRRNEDKKKIACDNESESSLEEGEIITDDENDDEILNDHHDMECDDSHSVDFTDDDQEAAAAWPPCLRIMVTKSFQPNLIGSLFIVTHPGGTIGSKEDCDICLSNAQPLHVEIKFNEDLQTYLMSNACKVSATTMSNQNVTFVGDTEDTEETDQWSQIKHGNVIEIFSEANPDEVTQLVIHIHSGNDTCDECEPGVVKAAIQKSQLETQQADIQLWKYDLACENNVAFLNVASLLLVLKGSCQTFIAIFCYYFVVFINDSYVINKNATDITRRGYVDKAEVRRKNVGSDNPYEKDATPSSTDIAISSNNKGFKMLQNMGWEKGQGLGKSQSGRQNPVSTVREFTSVLFRVISCNSLEERVLPLIEDSVL